MYYILYNPKSNSGKTAHKITKFANKLTKQGLTNKLINLLTLKNYDELRAQVKKEDIIVIAGGDGTLHRVVNNSQFQSLDNKIYMYRCGRGNDFARDHKGSFFEITDLVKNLPQATINGQKQYFLNGLGVGIDALTCDKQMYNYLIGKKESYFKIAFKAFFSFKPYDLEVNIDGKDYSFKNVWFFVIQNGKYFGGGMKISPKSDRLDDKLEFVVINDISFKKLLCVFPLIFIGKHAIARKTVKFISGQHFIVKANYELLQIDGEVEKPLESLEVTRF